MSHPLSHRRSENIVCTSSTRLPPRNLATHILSRRVAGSPRSHSVQDMPNARFLIKRADANLRRDMFGPVPDVQVLTFTSICATACGVKMVKSGGEAVKYIFASDSTKNFFKCPRAVEITICRFCISEVKSSTSDCRCNEEYHTPA